MTATSLYGDLEQAFAGGHGASPCGKTSCRHAGNIVHRKDRIRSEAGEQPVIDHRCRAKPVFFIGLENEDGAAVEITMLRQIRRSAEQHAAVPVMSAGMHHAVMFGTPFRISCFGDWQRVHIRPEGDAGLAVAALQDADDTGAADTLSLIHI